MVHAVLALITLQQPVDSAYTATIRALTTDSRFNTELTDHLPADPRVPTPLQALGYVPGTVGRLSYVADITRYLRALEAASPRLLVADGARLPPRSGRVALHPADSRQHHHPDHAGDRGGRARPHGRHLPLPQGAPQHRPQPDLLGTVHGARQQPRRHRDVSGAHADHAARVLHVASDRAPRPPRVRPLSLWGALRSRSTRSSIGTTSTSRDR